MSIISLTEGVAQLRAGNIVAIPTETVYGLAARIDDESALRQIFAVKERPFFDPLIIHVADVSQAKLLTKDWLDIYTILTEAFWPGPLTLVVPKTEAISPLITSGLESVALRCPRHPVALEILREVRIPLAAPSANRFGRTSPTRAEHVEAEFSGKIPVIDGGPSEIGLESTVIAVRIDPQLTLEILRPGGISRLELETALKMRDLPCTIERRHSNASPGSMKQHYQPSAPVVILENLELSDSIKSRIEHELTKTFLHFSTLPLKGSPQMAARSLFENFRQLSLVPESVIIAERTAENSGPEWEAIWDRIDRAASLNLK